MKTFFIFLSFAVFGVTFSPCEGRVRRQIWPAPQNPGFWPGHIHRYDAYDDSDPWMGPPNYDEPARGQNGFRRDDFGFGNDVIGGGRGNGGNRGSGSGGGRGNGGNRRDGGNNQNQNRRTTEISGPITTTPRTLHYAPQGCNCPITQQFNPVCGTDGNTYKNVGLLNCYIRCGRKVAQKRLGTC